MRGRRWPGGGGRCSYYLVRAKVTDPSGPSGRSVRDPVQFNLYTNKGEAPQCRDNEESRRKGRPVPEERPRWAPRWAHALAGLARPPDAVSGIRARDRRPGRRRAAVTQPHARARHPPCPLLETVAH